MSFYVIQSGNKFNPWAANLIKTIRLTEPGSRFWVPFSGTGPGLAEAHRDLTSQGGVEVESETDVVHETYALDLSGKGWSEIERRLKPGALQRILMADRFYGHSFVKSVVPDVSNEVRDNLAKIEHARALLCQLVLWILQRFDREKPKAVLCYCVAGSLSMALWEVADALGIPFFCIDYSRIDGFHHLAREPYNDFEDAQRLFSSVKPTAGETQFARDLIEKFRREPENNQPWKLFSDRLKGFQLSKIVKSYVGNLVRFQRWKVGVPYLGKPFERIERDRQCKLRGLAHLKSCEVQTWDDLPKSFIYVPLHTDPEASTMVRAPFLQNQAFFIENIVRSIGLTHAVVIKEHLLSLGWRREAFYEDLRKLPNVYFANPLLDGPKLIARSTAVATITGTSGWQGIVLSKPAITYSRPFYAALGEGFLNVESWTDLSEKWPTFIRNFEPVSDAKLTQMITAITRTSFPLTSAEMWAMQNPEHCAKECPGQIRILAEALQHAGTTGRTYRSPTPMISPSGLNPTNVTL